jgi:TRAP-type uncharacterized transport system fused permease subunit
MTSDTLQAGEPDIKALEERFDPEVRFRPLGPTVGWIAALLLFSLSVFHYYTAGFGLLREVTHRGVHMAFVLALSSLSSPLRLAARRPSTSPRCCAPVASPSSTGSLPSPPWSPLFTSRGSSRTSPSVSATR